MRQIKNVHDEIAIAVSRCAIHCAMFSTQRSLAGRGVEENAKEANDAERARPPRLVAG